MIAGNPFRIDERERPGLNRNRQPGVIEISWRVAEIDKQLHRLTTGGANGKRKKEDDKARDQEKSAHQQLPKSKTQ
jgi:hypothetical protein